MLYLNTKISEKTKDHLIYHSNQICKHTFDFLGTGKMNWGNPINWHIDIKSKYQWDNKFYTEYTILEIMPGNGIDIKIPWELNRLQHLVTLGQVYVFTKDKKYPKELCRQLNHWIESNRFCNGINWINTMEVGIRATNIIIALDLIRESKEYRENIEQYINLVRQHGLYIENNLEIGFKNNEIIAGNHYLANISGLAIIGMSCSHIPESKRWLKTGIVSLEEEINRMVLKDGFFFESSTSYHRLAVELFLYPLIFGEKLGVEFSKSYYTKIESMLDIILSLTSPNKTIPQIGDNDDGRLIILAHYGNWAKDDFRYLLGIGSLIFDCIAYKAVCGNCPEEIFWLYGEEGFLKYKKILENTLSLESKPYYDAGLFIIRDSGNKDYAVIRTKSNAGDLISAHIHNDILSFELWVGGRPLFIETGTYCYSSDIYERNKFRSTNMHNTLSINGEEINSLDPNRIFHLEQKTEVDILDWELNNENVCFIAEHDGFKHLGLGIKHRRELRYHFKNREWFLKDQVFTENNDSHKIILNFHVPSEVIINQDRRNIQMGNIEIKLLNSEDITIKNNKSYYSPSYGVKQLSNHITIATASDKAVSLIIKDCNPK